jgi:hypothetical protein
MSSIPTPAKNAPVVVNLTITMALGAAEFSIADLLKVISRAKEIKAANSQFGVVTGDVVIGKQKYKLDGAE